MSGTLNNWHLYCTCFQYSMYSVEVNGGQPVVVTFVDIPRLVSHFDCARGRESAFEELQELMGMFACEDNSPTESHLIICLPDTYNVPIGLEGGVDIVENEGDEFAGDRHEGKSEIVQLSDD